MSWARENDIPDNNWRASDLEVRELAGGDWAIVSRWDPSCIVENGFATADGAHEALAERYDDCD